MIDGREEMLANVPPALLASHHAMFSKEGVGDITFVDAGVVAPWEGSPDFEPFPWVHSTGHKGGLTLDLTTHQSWSGRTAHMLQRLNP